MLPRALDPATDPAEYLAAAGATSAHGATGTPDPAADSSAVVADERGIRLQAIARWSRTLFAVSDASNADERRRWLERWRAAASLGARSEPLAAFFYAGQKDAVSDLTASWLNPSDPDERERAEKIFLLAGLRMGNYPPLARWLWDGGEADGGERISRLVEVLQQFLSTGGQPSPQMVAGLFPAELRSRALLWRMASGVFAERRWYPQAAELGERALALPGGGLAFEAFQLAQWELDVGRIDAARTILRRAVDESEGTAYDDTADNAVFADLRAYYFLLPASERAGFANDYLRQLRVRNVGAAHAALAAALLHALTGDERAAGRELDRIVDMRLLDGRQPAESVDLRRWDYLYACGTQLQAWHLDRLAAHVWRQGLAGASAFDRSDPAVHNVLDEIRLHQLVVEVQDGR